ncbi:MAG: class I SAM-dependent methyltransferase [Saccharofermentans sp.]|nr:class I SAM-dependent methyltransferase [Saccharofermentans sp.]
MSKFTEYVGSQLSNPRGLGGKIVSLVQNIANSQLYRNTVAQVNVSNDEKLLDVGYGNGHLLKRIYKKCRPDMYGIDISDDAKLMATKRNRKAELAGKLHLQVGDCCALPFDDGMFAAVTTINTVYFWSDTVKGLSEIRRCLKNGGSFYNVAYTKEFLDTIAYTQYGFKKFKPDELVQLGKKAGFEKIEVKEISKGRSFIVVYTK